jgi:transposase
VWRHLNFFQFKAFLHARPPRCSCAKCGVKTVPVPWARPGSGFTLLFEALVLLMAKKMAVAPVGEILKVSDKKIWRILEHYVGKQRDEQDMSDVMLVGVDETSVKPGHKYVTVAADLGAAKVLFVTEGKDADTVRQFKADLKNHKGRPERIEAICSDLSPAFISGIAQEFPGALHVLDRFHVMKLVNTALDEVRRLEVKENDLLKQTRFIWLKNPDHLTERQGQKLDVLKTMNLATATAYQMKLNLRELWDQPDRETAAVFLERWYKWVMESDIAQAMKKVAKTIKAHATGILSYFKSRITNGLMEGINSLIKAAKAKARGFRSIHYFKIVIYLVAGKLDFQLPLTHSK